MKNATREMRVHGVELRMAGVKAKEAEATAGLNHSQLEQAVDAYRWVTEGTGQVPVSAIQGLLAMGISWGKVQIMTSDPLVLALELKSSHSEGSIRKRYSEETNLESVGIRPASKGGRFVNSDPVLYADELARTGTRIPLGEARNHEATRTAARTEKYLRMGWDALKAEAAEAGVKVTKATTPAALVAKLMAL